MEESKWKEKFIRSLSFWLHILNHSFSGQGQKTAVVEECFNIKGMPTFDTKMMLKVKSSMCLCEVRGG